MPASFIHTHVHSEYSLVDSTIRIKALIAACVRESMPAVAMTDDSNVFGLVKFYRAAKAAGIKPLAGCDVWLRGDDSVTRMTLLCQNHEGYLNLSRLISRAWQFGERHRGHPLLAAEWLRETNLGLIAIAGRHSDIAQAMHDADASRAHACLQLWQQAFPERLYLELTRCGNHGEEAWNDAAIPLAANAGLPLIASNDVRFLDRDDFEAHEARVCIQQGRVLNDPRRPKEYSAEQYLKTPAAMRELFADIPEAIDNTVELAKRCNLILEFGTYHLPNFPVPEQHNLDSYIRAQAHAGLERRLQSRGMAVGFSLDDYQQRLDREVDVILDMGFPGYFLIVADFIDWAKRNGIPVGPGRGSGAGSLVAYSLGITDLDPLRFGLLFERFLNPERVSMPDFDIDFCMDRRDEVIDYVAQRYGRDRVSQIITYGSMAAKAVLRDCGRVLGMPYGQVDSVAKMIPPRPLDLTLGDALGLSPRSHTESDRVSSEFKAAYADDDEIRDLIDLALKLENLTRNAGKHAGGVVIAPGPLSDFVPMFCEAGGGSVVTQFDKDDVEAIGLVKFDFLGLRTLTIIDWAVKAINARHADAEPIDIERLPLDDAAVFTLLCEARTVAVFQFESRGMQSLLKNAQPSQFEDIIALVALYRPGPMDLIPSYTRRRNGEEPVSYPDPRVEPLLRETLGVMVYQEQVMQMAQIIGGYTLGGADLLRRAMGKKKVAEMARHRQIFREGAANNGLDSHAADAIFDQMEKFAGYGFNKSHAAAYALVAYQTAWLKAHYPAEFMAATLSADMDSTDKVVSLLQDARTQGLRMLPPDVNASSYAFEALDDKQIRYGLGAIKGVGRGICDAIVAVRGTGYADLADFCQRVGHARLNKRTLEALITAGAMDSFGEHRASLMAQLPEAVRAAEQAARDAESGQSDIFGGAAVKPARRAQVAASVAEWPLEQLLDGERKTLGHYLSGHPVDVWQPLLRQLANCAIGDIAQQGPAPNLRENGRAAEQPWVVAGMLSGLRKRGDSMAFVQLEDASGRIEVALYREAFAEYEALLLRDAILVVAGSLGFDRFSGDYQLRTRRMWTLEQACIEHARMLRLQLGSVDADFIDHLRDAIHAHRGGRTPLRLTGYRNDSASADIELAGDWLLRATPDLAHALASLPGVDSAELLLNRPIATS